MSTATATPSPLIRARWSGRQAVDRLVATWGVDREVVLDLLGRKARVDARLPATAAWREVPLAAVVGVRDLAWDWTRATGHEVRRDLVEMAIYVGVRLDRSALGRLFVLDGDRPGDGAALLRRVTQHAERCEAHAARVNARRAS